MKVEKIEKKGIVIADVAGEDKVIVDTGSSLDVLMTAKYDVGSSAVMISKELVIEDFFILSTGIAGEILQKYINYGGKLAIYGDYSKYTSKPLKDFIYESNKGKDFFFVATKEEAVERLTAAK